eukprot:scaffold18476_cov52-Phaeocystis_antarctica.AAC.1
MAAPVMGLVPMSPVTEVAPVLVMPALVSRQKSAAVPRSMAGVDDDTAAAPTQFSTQWAPLNWATAAFFRGERLPCWILARSVFCSILTSERAKNLLCRAETPRSCREGEGGRSRACHAGACRARAFSSQWATGRSSSKTQGLGLGLKLELGPARGSPAWHLAGFWLWRPAE